MTKTEETRRRHLRPAPIERDEQPPGGDEPTVWKYPALSPRNIIYATISWMALFAVGSVAMANPFFTETSADANIITWHIMYLHGLLIGMVGITLLLAMSAFRLTWSHAWAWVGLGVLVATLLDTVGGVFCHQIPGSAGNQVAMWTQIVGFFALDEMLVVAGLAFYKDWRKKTAEARRLSFYLGWFATFSMLCAAIMGHLAGWILDYGNFPSFIGRYAKWVGENVATLNANLIGSHSHDMTVAFMVLVIASSVAFFAERAGSKSYFALRQFGLGLSLAASVVFTAMYVYGGFTAWAMPTFFATGSGGLASDDFFTAVAMVGGLIALWSAVLSRATKPLAPVIAAAWCWMLTVGLVVATGYWLEFHTTSFLGSKTGSGRAADAIFTWFHQDVGLFLFPFMAVVMLVTARYVIPKYQARIAVLAAAGSTILFAGGMIYVFADQARHGTGYVFSTIGLLLIGAAFVATIWWGFGSHLLGGRRQLAPPAPTPLVPARRTEAPPTRASA
jgi:hypothetical protein